jgi:hypothetical protein
MMNNRKVFMKSITEVDTTLVGYAIALLWFYCQVQEYDERSAGALAADLREEGFSKPNVTRLSRDLKRNKFVVKGKRQGTFQLNIRYLSDLDSKYGDYLKLKACCSNDSIIPSATVANTRKYLDGMVHQINASYEAGMFDCCAVMMRRLMESLLIEIYVKDSRQSEIRVGNAYIMLDPLIKYAKVDGKITFSRNAFKTMENIKLLGDTAAHDRTYITFVQDVDDVKMKYRRLIVELLHLSGIVN